jgi:RNA polymerase sigma factor (sigma-70 family)
LRVGSKQKPNTTKSAPLFLQFAPMLDTATREAQATACLEAAEHHRELLLALATKLAGNPEDGMDLFQQTLLNCHDAIQRNGFAGDKYQFYLYTSLKNQFKKDNRRRGREVQVDFQALESSSSTRDDEGSAPWAANISRQHSSHPTLKASAMLDSDPLADLADEVMEAVREQFSFVDRITLRLHIDGMSFREIAQLIGRGEQTQFWRRVEKMKAQLRETFQQAYDALIDPD